PIDSTEQRRKIYERTLVVSDLACVGIFLSCRRSNRYERRWYAAKESREAESKIESRCGEAASATSRNNGAPGSGGAACSSRRAARRGSGGRRRQSGERRQSRAGSGRPSLGGRTPRQRCARACAGVARARRENQQPHDGRRRRA